MGSEYETPRTLSKVEAKSKQCKDSTNKCVEHPEGQILCNFVTVRGAKACKGEQLVTVLVMMTMMTNS